MKGIFFFQYDLQFDLKVAHDYFAFKKRTIAIRNILRANSKVNITVL